MPIQITLQPEVDLWLTVGEDCFSPAAGQQEARLAGEFFWRFLVRPQEHVSGPRPKHRKGIGCFEYVGCVGKFLTVPEIPAGLVQNAHRDPGVEIQGGRLMILTINDNHIARTKLLLDCHREVMRGKNWRKLHERNMNASQKDNHHRCQSRVARGDSSTPAQPEIQQRSKE